MPLEQTLEKLKTKKEIMAMIEEAVKKEIERQIFSKIEMIKGEKGDDGNDALPLTDEYLLGLINPLIPDVRDGRDGEDGKTPSAKELLALIKPLIPQVKDGKTPTKQELIDLIKPFILLPIREDNKPPDTPEEIAKKLNKTEESVKISVIKGLESQIKNIFSSLREKKGGGGGMGNWIHQSFNVNSSTTTITLSNNIAANGFAVLAFYQGQFIVRGTHYTQSGKVLTLTFTPDDNTIIDIAFVRT